MISFFTMRSHQIRVDPKPMTGILIRRPYENAEGGRPCKDRDQNDVATSQVTPRTEA